jgi:hypothetical protein
MNAGKRSRSKDFRNGYYCAVATLIITHDAHVQAEDVLRAYGPIDMCGVDEFDAKMLRPVVAEIRRKNRMHRKPTK